MYMEILGSAIQAVITRSGLVHAVLVHRSSQERAAEMGLLRAVWVLLTSQERPVKMVLDRTSTVVGCSTRCHRSRNHPFRHSCLRSPQECRQHRPLRYTPRVL